MQDATANNNNVEKWAGFRQCRMKKWAGFRQCRNKSRVTIHKGSTVVKTRSQVGPLGPKWQRGGVDAGAGVHAGVGVHAGAGVHEHELMRARCIHVMIYESDR